MSAATRNDLGSAVLRPSANHGGHESERTTFPAVFFLDATIFKILSLEIPRAQAATPNHVKELLGDSTSIQTTVSQYFKMVHDWMAIISKKRFYIQQLNPLSQPRADVVLLLLCMKLVVWLPSGGTDDPRTTLYKAAKSFHSDLETMGTCSIQVLQAGILIAVYELGHCIYPAAYMSIGACARLGTAFGFDGSIATMNRSSDWMDTEERKRAWWATIILDRFVIISFSL